MEPNVRINKGQIQSLCNVSTNPNVSVPKEATVIQKGLVTNTNNVALNENYVNGNIPTLISRQNATKTKDLNDVIRRISARHGLQKNSPQKYPHDRDQEIRVLRQVFYEDKSP